MASEKNALPPYTMSEPPVRSSSNKKTVLLASYGAAVTALLVAGVVFGSLLYVQQQQSCVQATIQPTSEPSKEVVEMSNGERQEIQRDYGNEVELIKFLNNWSTNGALLALDFRKSLTALYIPGASACYLIGGIDTTIPSPFQNKDTQDVNRNETNELNYQIASDYPILDRSILPLSLHESCLDRQVYWLEPQGEFPVGHRGKRDVSVTISVNVDFKTPSVGVSIKIEF